MKNSISKAIFDYDYEKISSLLAKFEHNPEYISRLINSEDCRKIQPIFLCIYLREALKDKPNKKQERENLLNIIKILIKYNVKIRVRNEDKRTPLEEAVAYVSSTLIKYFFKNINFNRVIEKQ